MLTLVPCCADRARVRRLGRRPAAAAAPEAAAAPPPPPA